MNELLIGTEDGVRTITLNRPEKLNALNTELTVALRDALQEADRDRAVRCVVLTGAGGAFCAGADLAEFEGLTPEHHERITRRASLTAEVQSLPRTIGVPVVGAVAGAAVGGGAGLALACDMLVVAEDVRFGYPEIRHAIVPALVMTSAQRHFGPKLGFELVATGRMLTASDLAELGIANRVVPSDRLGATAQELAASLAAARAPAMRSIKSLFHRVADLPFEAAIAAGRDVNTIMRGYRR